MLGGSGSMNHRPTPRRKDYYGSSSRNTGNRTTGSRSMSNYDVGEDESMSIHSYESIYKPPSYRSGNDRYYQPDSRWLAQQGSRNYRNISPSSYHGHQQFDNRDRYDMEMSRDRNLLRQFINVDQDPHYYSPRIHEMGSIRVRERHVKNVKPKKLVPPIAGAAGIVVCSKCSILVVLPRRFRIMENDRREIQCGSCSSVMLIELDGTRMRVSTIVKEIRSDYSSVHDDTAAAAAIDDPIEAIRLKCRALIASAVGFNSHEYLVEKEEIVEKEESRQTLSPRLDNEISSAMSELEVSHDAGFPQDSEEVINKEDLDDDHDLQTKDRNQTVFVEGETEEKPTSVRTEVLEDRRDKVVVNGHTIPDFAVKNAEIMAGPILPGNYWYDYNAGFWGVMNYPCLGIIPPFIEEFNSMMPQRCAAGNTGVFVNGRELHQRDLDLLASRGLPTTMYKSYTVQISGKVFDERTGEELYEHHLGKLAPSVENAKRGYGMRVPKGVA